MKFYDLTGILQAMLDEMLDEMLDAFDHPLVSISKIINSFEEMLDAFDQGFTNKCRESLFETHAPG